MSVALITGGSSGIGFAVAKQLAQQGFSLLLVSNQEIELAKCKQEIEQHFPIKCHTLFKDLTSATAAQEIFDLTKQNNLEISVLVNNAGILVFSEVVATPLEKVNAILQIHIHTPSMLCRLFGEEMRKARHGFILNVSSISAVMPYPGISLYGPSKTYMRYFTRALRSEMKQYNIHVTCLIPGATATALYDPNRVNLSLAKRLGVMQSAEKVAKTGLKSLFKNQAESIPGILNKITVGVLPFIPAGVARLIHQKTKILNVGNQALG